MRSMSVTGAWLSLEHEISASDWLRRQFLAVVLASQSKVVSTLSARASFFSQLLVNHGRVCQISCEIFRI